MRKLPASWAWTTLGDIAEIGPVFDRSQVDPDLHVSFVPMASVQTGTGTLDASATRPFRDVSKGYVPFLENDILFARITPCMENGKVAIARNLANGIGVGSTEFYVIRACGCVDPSFLLHYLLQERVRHEARAVMRGAAGQLRVPTSFLRNLAVPLPPPAEQRRIVAEIEKCFADFEAAGQTLRSTLSKLDTLVSVILISACLKSDSNDICFVPVSTVGDVQLGRQRSPQHHHGPNMRPYLRVANIYEDRIDLTDVKEMNFTPAEFEMYELQPTDILLNEGQSIELVGRPAMYRGEIEGCCFQNTLVRFRTSDCVLPEYAVYVFRAWLRAGEFRKVARWTTNIAHLGADRFSAMPFPIRSKATQQAIIDGVDASLSSIRHLAAEVKAALRRAARFRQAILARAFEGKLVPQDPNDEPAYILLERLRTSRAQTPPARRSPRKGAREVHA